MSNFFKSVGGAIGVDTKNVDKEYTKYKWQVFVTIFVAYVIFYITRKNLSFAKPYLIQLTM